MTETIPDLPAAPSGNWFQRNWRWFVPALGISMVVAFLGLVFLFIFGIMSMLKSSDTCQEALARSKANPTVVEALGTPIELGFFVSGNVNLNGSSGNADLVIPISGPKDKATIYVQAERELGLWNYKNLVVEIKSSGQRIDLAQP